MLHKYLGSVSCLGQAVNGVVPPGYHMPPHFGFSHRKTPYMEAWFHWQNGV